MPHRRAQFSPRACPLHLHSFYSRIPAFPALDRFRTQIAPSGSGLNISGVFGTEFTAESIVGENRLSVEEFIPLTEVTMQRLSTPDELLALPDPASGEEALLDLIEAVTARFSA